MALVDARQFQLSPNVGQAVQQGLALGQQFTQGQDRRVAAKQLAQSNQFAGQAAGGDQAALSQLAGVDAQRAAQIQGVLANQSEEQRAETIRENESLTKTALIAQTLPAANVRKFIESQRDKAIEAGRDTSKMDKALGGNDEQLLEQIKIQSLEGQKIAAVAKQVFPVQSAAGAQFKELTKGLSDEDQLLARRVELGISPRAVGSGAITTATTPGLPEQVAESEGIIAGAKEQGKLKKKLTFAPQIAKAVKIAEEEGKARGEAITDLTRAKAAMPGLLSAVGQLKELAPIATSTLGGKAFDFAVKESGFGSTKGANAKAKFIAIINNQVLPLLKPTFGAAFTVQEGESLKATMGDPNATPSQKLEQLNAFIDQKFRNMEALESEIGATSTEFKDVSDDDLLSF